MLSVLLSSPASVMASPVEWGETPQPRGVAILVHGLNNSAGVMRPIAAILRANGFTTGIVTLDGHGGSTGQTATSASGWVENLRHAAMEAGERYPGIPLLGLGFSLGGAVCLRALDDGVANFHRMVLVAPAIELKGYTSLLRLITWLRFFSVGVPSFIPAEYRSSPTTPLDHYEFLFESIDTLRTRRFDRRTISVPTLIVLRDSDEFVSVTRTDRFRREAGFDDWRIVTLSAGESDLPAHLMVDERSFGTENWRRFVDEISDFLGEF